MVTRPRFETGTPWILLDQLARQLISGRPSTKTPRPKTVLTTFLWTTLSIFELKYFCLVLRFVVKNYTNYVTSEFKVNVSGLDSASLSTNGLLRNRILLPTSLSSETSTQFSFTGHALNHLPNETRSMRIFSSEAQHVTWYSFYSTNSFLALLPLKLLYFGL